MAGFDINDRSTWAWANDGALSGGPGDYALNPQDKYSFYQFDDSGNASLHQCPMETATDRLLYDPSLNVCITSQDITETQVYDYAVKNGLVADQR